MNVSGDSASAFLNQLPFLNMNCNNESINVLKCQWDAKEIGSGGGGNAFRELFQCLDFNENHTLSSQLIIYLMQTWLPGAFPCSLPHGTPKKVGKPNLTLLSRKCLWFGAIIPKASLLTSLLRWEDRHLIILPIHVLHWYFTHILKLWPFLAYAKK